MSDGSGIYGPVGIQGTRLIEVLTGRVLATCSDGYVAATLAALLNERLAEETEGDDQ